MSTADHSRQKLLTFPKPAETRAERIELLLGKAPNQLTTAARMFDDRAFVEATRIAKGEQQ